MSASGSRKAWYLLSGSHGAFHDVREARTEGADAHSLGLGTVFWRSAFATGSPIQGSLLHQDQLP